MIDHAQARTIVEFYMLGYESNIKTPVEILDDLTTEHEWGWTFYCQAKDVSKVPPEWSRFEPIGYLVDRVAGVCVGSSTSGPKMDLMQLFYWRDQKLAEKK